MPVHLTEAFMAVISPSWREELKADLLTTILEGFSLNEEDRDITAGKDHEKTIKTLAWCFAVLGKPATDLNEEQLKPEKVQKLVTDTLHVSVKKVAKEHLKRLVFCLKTAITVDACMATIRKDIKELECDGFVMVGSSSSEVVVYLKENIALLKQWHNNPSLILPDNFK
jgi:hypothetical protein